MNWIALLLFGGLGLTALVGGLVWGGNRAGLIFFLMGLGAFFLMGKT